MLHPITLVELTDEEMQDFDLVELDNTEQTNVLIEQTKEVTHCCGMFHQPKAYASPKENNNGVKPPLPLKQCALI